MRSFHGLVIADPAAGYLKVLDRIADRAEFTIGDRAGMLEAAAPRADVIFACTGRHDVLRDILPLAPKVRWIHSLYAGVEGLLYPDLIDSPIPLTNGRGLYKRSLAEFVLAAMLYFAKDLERMRRNQKAGIWEPFDVEMLAGATLGVAGFGEIGRAAAKLAEPFGMRILPLRRQTGNLDELLSESDYLLIAAPITAETRGMIGENEIARMKPGAVLINVGRGPVVQEEALVRALEERRIRGAALDVFDEEPLPAGHPFWRLDNVLLSPHTADHTATWLEEAASFFVENFERFAAGQPLENMVDKKAGY